MKKTRKTRKIKQKIYKGGKLPEANLLSFFKITDENLLYFQRQFPRPMDCVINALQILGLIDNTHAQIMRISSLGHLGITKEQIELIFIYLKKRNFKFINAQNIEEWIRTIERKVPPGSVVFGGYSIGTEGHVFLIGRNLKGHLVYIDPQVSPHYCIITDENYNNCSIQNIIRDNGGNDNFKLYLLLTSPEESRIEEINEHIKEIIEKKEEDDVIMREEIRIEYEDIEMYEEKQDYEPDYEMLDNIGIPIDIGDEAMEGGRLNKRKKYKRKTYKRKKFVNK
jgi:hypothetical protein